MKFHSSSPNRLAVSDKLPFSVPKYLNILKPESEAAIQAAFFRWCQLQSGALPELELFHSIPNGSHKGFASRYLHKATGLKSGVPDTFLPVARSGFHGLYLEFKSATGRLSPEQKWWIEHLSKQGYLVLTCRDWKKAAEITVAYLNENLEEIERFSDGR